MIAPKENPSLVGHAQAEETLLSAVNSGRLHHAWLITGPQGVGKATLAYRFARFLLANEPPPDDAPGLFGDAPSPPPAASLAMEPDHPIFRRVAAGGHMDFKTLDQESATGRTSQIPVDAVRSLAPFLRQTAGEGGRRLVVIDAMDDINPTGANALLKIVEEPPAGAVLLLVAHQLTNVLPTIRSRCRVLRLAPLSADEVATVLRQQDETLANNEIERAAALSGGSPGEALALLEGDGLAIHDAVAAFWQHRSTMRADALAALAALAGQDAARFRHFVRAFCTGIVTAAAEAGNGSRAWDAFWADTLHLCDRTEAVYLDRRQVALNRLTAAAKLG